MGQMRYFGTMPDGAVTLGNPELVRLAERHPGPGIQVWPVPPAEPVPRGSLVEPAEVVLRAAQTAANGPGTGEEPGPGG